MQTHTYTCNSLETFSQGTCRAAVVVANVLFLMLKVVYCQKAFSLIKLKMNKNLSAVSQN